MARPCTVCTSPHRAAIEAELSNGAPLLSVAKKYGVSRQALDRHHAHMVRDVRAALQNRSVETGVSILERLRNLNRESLGILAEARQEGQRRDALAAIHALSRLLELEARLLGELAHERPQTTVQVALVQSPEWHKMRELIAQALQPYPEARQAVAAALEDAGHG